MKPELVYHGSAKTLVGERLKPRKARDLGNNPANTQNGIYATDVKNHAIIMAILGSKGVEYSSLAISDPDAKGIVFKGWPEQKEVFVYDLSPRSFKRTGENSHQWVSLEAVKPKMIEKIKVEDYIHLIRGATAEEKKKWTEKYGKEI